MKLTAKQVYCLRYLGQNGPAIAFEIAEAAKHDGTTSLSWFAEWAHAPLRELRDRGLVEYTGQKERATRIHRITDAGRAALAEIEGRA